MSVTLLAWAMLASAPGGAAPETVLAQADTAPAAEEAQIAAPPAQDAPVEAGEPLVAADPLEDAFANEVAVGDDPIPGTLRDPLEGWNRRVYGFNDVVDRYALEPVARGYRAVTPRFVRTGVSNMLSNAGTPVTFANSVLQGNFKRAGSTAGRFAINSTFGVLGLFDPATEAGLQKSSEDFGQTLGVWGVGPGPYLVLPLFGPSTVRDALGRGVDIAFDPLTYGEGEDITEARAAFGVAGAISAREAAIEQIESIRETSRDPYVTLRSLYGQARASAIRNGEQTDEDLVDFGETEMIAPEMDADTQAPGGPQ